MLPPGLQNRPTHKYGEFNITINAINIKNSNAQYAEINLIGIKKSIKRQVSSSRSSSFDFDIVTNLWHFYAYLNDARTLNISFLDSNERIFNCEIHLNLMPSRQVLCKNQNNIGMLFQGNSYLLNQRNRCDILDSRYAKVGEAQVRLNLNFNEAINRTLMQADLIDFQDILVIDEISPISSTIQLNNIITQMQEIAPISMPLTKLKEPMKIYNIPHSLQHLEQQLKINDKHDEAKQMEISHLEDQKMMEDDIDRMIAQMQNRPYDSSKYMQEVKEEPKKQNINYINFSLTTVKSKSNQKRQERVISAQKLPPRVPPMLNTTKSKAQYSVSPSKLAYTISNPIMNYSPHSLSLNQTQVTNQNQSNYQQYDKKIGLIKLKVHEFTMSKMERQLSLLLKIYLNQDNEEFYTINGLRQGETISFNSNLKIDQKRQISTIKFILIDSYDMKTVFSKGIFEMNRLFSLNPTKGIFMVNLLSAPIQQNQSKIIRMQEQSLVRVTPNLKNLRIQLEYEQPIQIVQIYLSLSDFSNNCRKICYKVPFTKESIQFRVAELNKSKHINIFPHNRSSSNRASDKIIIQVWGDIQLIGLNQINLKPIANTNQSIINSSLQPIFLYDQDKDVNDFKSGKNRASYKIKLYYGSIAQVQGLLNKQDNKQKRFEQSKTAVQVQSHLGIYIKQNKVRKEVQIQVDEEDMHATWKGSQRNLLSLQQEELPDDDEQQQQIVNHKMNQSENQFLSESIEQKYVISKQTMPILKNDSKETSLNGSKCVELSQTIKPKALKSLTKQFQQEIKLALMDFESEQQFFSLKQSCKSHLLYNFIDVKTLENIMKEQGIKQRKIDFLMNDVLLISNDMINVNILYDMILGLKLEGEVKQKFIDDGQIGRYCLMKLYKGLLEDEEDDFLFDDNTEFDQSRKIYQKIQYKLTMRQFGLIHNFVKREKQSTGMSYMKIKQVLAHRKIVDLNTHKQIIYESQLHQDLSELAETFKPIISNHYEEPQTFQPIQSEFAETFKPTKQYATLRTKPNFKLSVEGFEACIDTIQCLMNIPLRLPRLRLTCKTEHQEQQFWINKASQEDHQIQLFTNEDYLDGTVEFIDNLQLIARCNFSIMPNMKSCYSLKNVDTLQFCGILKLLLQQL